MRAEELTHLGPRDLLLELDYVDRSGLRLAGWLTWILGVVGGGAIAIAGIFSGPEECSDLGRCRSTLSLPMLIAGGAIVCVAPLVGVPLAFWGRAAGQMNEDGDPLPSRRPARSIVIGDQSPMAMPSLWRSWRYGSLTP